MAFCYFFLFLLLLSQFQYCIINVVAMKLLSQLYLFCTLYYVTLHVTSWEASHFFHIKEFQKESHHDNLRHFEESRCFHCHRLRVLNGSDKVRPATRKGNGYYRKIRLYSECICARHGTSFRTDDRYSLCRFLGSFLAKAVYYLEQELQSNGYESLYAVPVTIWTSRRIT